MIPVAVGGRPEPLDVAAAWSKDQSALTLGIVNPMKTPIELPVEFKGVELTGKGRLFVITGPDGKAFNEPGKEPAVKIEEREWKRIEGRFTVPPISVALYVLPVK